MGLLSVSSLRKNESKSPMLVLDGAQILRGRDCRMKKNAGELVGNWSKSSGSGDDEIWNVSVQSVFVLRVVSPRVLFCCVNLKHYRKLKNNIQEQIIVLKATAGPKSLLFKLLPWKLTCPLKIDGWEMYSLLKWWLFRGHVSSLEGKSFLVGQCFPNKTLGRENRKDLESYSTSSKCCFRGETSFFVCSQNYDLQTGYECFQK